MTRITSKQVWKLRRMNLSYTFLSMESAMRLHCPSNSLSFMDITHFSRLTSYRCIAKKTPNIIISEAPRAREACACGAPRLSKSESKSTHLRKFGNHVSVNRPTGRPSDRPSTPQAYQCKITQSTYEVILAGNRIATRVL